MLKLRFGLASLIFAAFSASYAHAGAAREDPKGEPRKDPHEQRDSLEQSRVEFQNFKRAQRLLRLDLQKRLAEKQADASPSKKTKSEQTGNSSAAAATPQAQKPAKKIVKPKVLAKAAGAKNPHEVFASAEDAAENQPADVNAILLRDLETHLGGQPYYQSFTSRTFDSDPGSGLLAKFHEQARSEGIRSEEVFEAEALKRVGDQPQVGYFVSRNPSQRAAVMADTAYADTLENIKTWRRIAMLDPDPDVRKAAALRLDRAGKTLANKYLRGLHPTERRLVGNIDPFDPAAREFLENLVSAPTGSQIQPGLTPNLQNVASRMLEEFPMSRPWREDVEASLEAHKLPAVQAEMSDERAKEMNEAAKAKQAALTPQPKILYIPTASLEARIDALEDGSVEKNHENWQSWIYVARNDSDATVQRLAWERAAEASPAYEFTKNASPLVQFLMADIDPLTFAGHERLIAITRSEWNFHDRIAGGLEPISGEAQITRDVAHELLEAYTPRAKNFEERARLRILAYAADASTATLHAFEHLNLSDAAHAETELKALLQRAPGDAEIQALARIVLETVVHPPQPGTLRAIVARYLADASVRLAELRDPLVEQIWQAADRSEELLPLVTQLKSQFMYRSEDYNHFDSLVKDLRARAYGEEDLDRATPQDLAQAAVVETEFVAQSFSKIGYYTNRPADQRLAAVKANELTVEDYNEVDERTGKTGYQLWLGIAFSDPDMFVRAEARIKLRTSESDLVELGLTDFFTSHPNYDDHEAEELVTPLREEVTEQPSQPTYRNLRDPAVHEELRAYATRLESREETHDFGVAVNDLLNHFRPYPR